MPLYRGQLRVNVPEGEFFVDGTVEMAWQPTVQVRYKSFADLPTKLAVGLFTEDFDSDFYPADITVVPKPPEAAATDDRAPTVEGQVIQLEIGSGAALSHLRLEKHTSELQSPDHL